MDNDIKVKLDIGTFLEFIMKCIGTDVFIELSEELPMDDAKRQAIKDNTRTKLNNFLKGKNYDNTFYIEKLKNFLSAKTTNKKLNEYLKTSCTVSILSHIASEFKLLLCAYIIDNEDEKIIYRTIFRGVVKFISDIVLSDRDYKDKLDIIYKIYFKNNYSYKDFITTIITEKQINKTKMCDALTEIANKINYDVNPSHFESVIRNMEKKEVNPNWLDFKVIIKYVSYNQYYVYILFDTYFINNIKSALRNILQMDDKSIIKLKDEVEKYIRAALNDKEDFIVLLEKENEIIDNSLLVVKDCVDFVTKSATIYSLKDDFEQKVKKLNQFRDEALEKKHITHAMDFYYSWKMAELCVYYYKNKEAKSYFCKAFDNIRYASIYASSFLDQAISFYIHKNINLAKNAYQDNKVPIPKEAKRFWQYGVMLGLISKRENYTLTEVICHYQLFYRFFPEVNFIDYSESKPKDNAYEIDFENFGKKLLNYKNITVFNSMYTHYNYNIRYTGLTFILKFALKHEECLSVLEDIIDNPDLYVSKQNQDLSVAIDTALSDYIWIKHKHKSFADRYKNILIKLINRTDIKCFKTDLLNFNHPLSNAIYSNDLELVKLILSKGIDIEHLKFSILDLDPISFTLYLSACILTNNIFLNSEYNNTYGEYYSNMRSSMSLFSFQNSTNSFIEFVDKTLQVDKVGISDYSRMQDYYVLENIFEKFTKEEYKKHFFPIDIEDMEKGLYDIAVCLYTYVETKGNFNNLNISRGVLLKSIIIFALCGKYSLLTLSYSLLEKTGQPMDIITSMGLTINALIKLDKWDILDKFISYINSNYEKYVKEVIFSFNIVSFTSLSTQDSQIKWCRILNTYNLQSYWCKQF